MTIPSPLLTTALALATRWEEAWNRHDVPGLAALVAPDADFVTVAGVWLTGIDEFATHHRLLHDGQMRDSRWSTLGVAARSLDARVALAHVEWAIAGDRDPDGAPRQGRRGHFTWVLRDCPEWRIAVAQNTNLAGHATLRALAATQVQP